MSIKINSNILNFENPDSQFISTFENLVNMMQNSNQHGDIKEVNEVLDSFSKRQDAIKFVMYILEHSTNPNAHFLAFKIMQDYVKKYWFVLPDTDRAFVKNKVVQLLKVQGENELQYQQYKQVLSKLNLAFVEIVKQEYDKTWETVFTDICNFSLSGNLLLTENCVNILKTLSEEIFEFGKRNLKQEALAKLKSRFVNDFQQIFNLCSKILHEQSSNPGNFRPSLIKSVLDTFTHFLTWIPIGYIFLDDTINIITELITEQRYQIEAINCMSEIANISMDAEQLTKQGTTALELFHKSIEKIRTLIGDTSFVTAQHSLGPDDRNYFENFLKSFTSQITGIHINYYMNFWTTSIDNFNLQYFNYTLNWIIQLVDFPENEVLKTITEFTYVICKKFYDQQFAQYLSNNANPGNEGLNQNTSKNNSIPQNLSDIQGNLPNLQKMQVEALKEMMAKVVQRMVRPQEVRLAPDDNGMLIWYEDDNTEQSEIHNLLASCIQKLAVMFQTEFKMLCINDLKEQLKEECWNRERLFKLSWSIGCLTEVLNDQDERGFVISAIRELLTLCEKKSGKDNKACVASNIMQVVGQYPRFLRNHYKFLKTVIRKLFEFLEEPHPGVQDMASETLLKIFKKTKIEFVQNLDTKENFLDELCEKLNSIMSLISMNNVLQLQEGFGIILSQFTTEILLTLKNDRQLQVDDNLNSMVLGKQNLLINTYMNAWESGIAMNAEQIFCNPESLQYDNSQSSNLMAAQKVMGVFCLHCGQGFELQFIKEQERLKSLLLLAVNQIQQSLASQNYSKLRVQKQLRKQIVQILANFYQVCHDNSINNVSTVCCNEIDLLLSDQLNCTPEFKEPEVLNLFAVFLQRIEVSQDYLRRIISCLLDSSLQFLSQDQENYPELRVQLFNLLTAMVRTRLGVVFALGAEGFEFVFKCLAWGINHHQPNIGDKVLDCALTLLERLEGDAMILASFAQNQIIRMTDMTFRVLLDAAHRQGEKKHIQLLQKAFTIILNCNLSPLSENTAGVHNRKFFLGHVCNMLKEWFSQLDETQLKVLIIRAIKNCNEYKAFKQSIIDLMLSTEQSSIASEINNQELNILITEMGNDWV